MAAMSVISDYVRISHTKIFQVPDADDIAGEPHLILGFVYNIDGERLEDIRAQSRHRFSECNPASLRAFIQEKEPIPLDTIIDPQVADINREMIFDFITSLVYDCIRVEGLKILQVNIIVEINYDEEDFDLIESDVNVEINQEEVQLSESGGNVVYFHFIESNDAEFLRESRMNLLQKKVYMGTAMAEENEVCSICLDELRVGEEVVCTPCAHHFHDICIGRWFEKIGFCPLCRFKIEPF